MSDPLYALQPVTDIGAQYAEKCTAYLESAVDAPEIAAPRRPRVSRTSMSTNCSCRSCPTVRRSGDWRG